MAFLDEMRRCEQLGLAMLNFHPGSHLREIDTDACLGLIAESLNRILDETSGVKAVIENTAGQGSNLGYTFEQIAHIIDAPILTGNLNEWFWHRLMNDSRMDNIPLILETPNEDIWIHEIKQLYAMIDE